MSILIQNGDIIAGGGVPVLHMTYAEYLANKTALDNTDVFVDITDEPDQLAYADEIGYGDTTLDYVGDIATQALGDVELTDTATKLHTVGSYFVNKAGKYCKTTVQINVGSTIVVGTNCVETDIASEISGIKSDLIKIKEISVNIGSVSAGFYTVVSPSDLIAYTPTGYHFAGIAFVNAMGSSWDTDACVFYNDVNQSIVVYTTITATSYTVKCSLLFAHN